jgi:hypothetical protein
MYARWNETIFGGAFMRDLEAGKLPIETIRLFRCEHRLTQFANRRKSFGSMRNRPRRFKGQPKIQ